MPIQTAADSISNSAGSPYGFKNRIINGAMPIDQRNAGVEITGAGNVYTVDRFLIQGSQTGKFNVQQVTDAPSGFSNSLKFTVGTAVSVGSGDYFITRQAIEGLNVRDLDYGSSTAKTVTLSFWVKSSITGLHSGHLTNNNSSRWYPFSYTINQANTWEYETITIPGDTTGTWLKDNNVGIYVGWSLGTGSSALQTANAWTASTGIAATGSVNVVATSGATFFITGVQFEKGTQATAFDYRPYTTEFQLCQRYFWRVKGSDGQYVAVSSGLSTGSTTARHHFPFQVAMRTAPTISVGGTFYCYDGGNLVVTSLSVLPGLHGALIDFTGSSGGATSGRGSVGNLGGSAASEYIQANAEL
jgi:hypothetical protein